MSADNTRGNHGKHAPWEPGQSGNPNGRPKGARNKLGEDFIQALYADWQEHGKAVIDRVREERPHEYLKLVASLLPKRIELRADPFEEISDEELGALLDYARAQIAAAEQEAADEAETIAAAIIVASRPVTH